MPSSSDAEPRPSGPSVSGADLDRPPSGEYLMAFSTRLTSDLPGAILVRRDGGTPSATHVECDVRGRVGLRRLGHPLDIRRGSNGSVSRSTRPTSSWLASRIWLTIVAEPVRLVDDERDEPRAAGLVEREVVPAERLRCPVHGRKRRA